jgi:hypothetical protein
VLLTVAEKWAGYYIYLHKTSNGIEVIMKKRIEKTDFRKIIKK